MRGNPTTFLTLTVNPRRGQSPDDRARELSEALRVLVKRARRKFPKVPFEYFAVFEETKKGEPHLHILARAPFIPQRWLSDQMAELIEAPIVDIRRAGSARGAARYVAKYVAKGPRSFARNKRYWSSGGYDPDRKERLEQKRANRRNWFVVRQPLWLVAKMWAVMGYEPHWQRDDEIVALNSQRRSFDISEFRNWLLAQRSAS